MPLPASAAAAALFSCAFDGFLLSVAPDLSYSVAAADGGAPPWLVGGGLALLDLSPGAGLSPAGAPLLGVGVDAELGAFSFLSVPWAANASTAPSAAAAATVATLRGAAAAAGAPLFVSNITCYTDFSLAAFSLTFPLGLATFGGASEKPATRFPSFSADSGTALRSDAMGFIEWAGEMSEYGDKHGVALNGFGGGRQSGPLLLFNKTQLALGAPRRPAALVLGPGAGAGTHLVHTVIAVMPGVAGTAAAAPRSYPVDPGCLVANHTDKVGGGNAPGSGNGLVVQQGNSSACCAACRALGAACDSFVYDTDGFAGDGHNCWPLLGLTGSEQASDRVLGLAHAVQCAPQSGTTASGGVPAAGFESGQAVASRDECCVLCATLGPAACSAWTFDEARAICTPLLSFAGTAPAPSLSFGTQQVPPSQLAVGVQGLAASLPPGFVVSAWLAGSQGGLSDATMHYGEALRAAARLQRTPREQDPMRNVVSYWSDNGAFYFDGYWPMFFDNVTNTAQDVFLALKAYHAELGLTVGTYQMDPWWYGGSCGSNGPPPPECNVVEAWPWSANFSAAPGFFPDGLAALGLPLTLYSNLYAQASNGNKMTQRFSWMNDSCGGIAPCAIVVPEQSYDFHSWAFDAGKAMGQNAFEIDFADYIFPFALFASDVRAFDQYWAGVNTAAVEHAFPVQLCMSLPLMTLDSVFWPAVTNARLQGDGYATNTGRYDIFQTSLLYSAVALAPFLDNIWSTSCQPALDNPYGNATCEGHVEGLAAIATLSAGPVGFADRVGFTNATLLNMSARADGVLLQPSLPAVNVEAYFADRFPPQGESVGMARITSAPSFVPLGAPPPTLAAAPAYAYPLPAPHNARSAAAAAAGAPGSSALFLSVFATFVGVPIPIAPIDLWPPLPVGAGVGGYFVTMLSRASLCVDGAPAVASGCASSYAATNASAPMLVVDTGPFDHEVYSVAPVMQGGWALLGELGKFTRVAAGTRVVALDTTDACGAGAPSPFCVALAGAAGERVEMGLVDAGGVVRIAAATLDAGGSGRITCSCPAGACACTT